MLINKYLILIIIPVLVLGCNPDIEESNSDELDSELEELLIRSSPSDRLDYYELPDEGEYAQIPQDPKNPLTLQKIRLGKLLYHESALGIEAKSLQSMQTFSCASCHFAEAGFQAGRFQGLSDGAHRSGEARTLANGFPAADVDAQDVRSPTVLNTAYQSVTLWNGQFGATGLNVGTESEWTAETPKEVNHLGYEGVETQAIAGLEVHRMNIDMDILGPMGYKSMFDAAFPTWPESRRYSKESAGLAIAAYERTLLANRAPFQHWLRGTKGQMTDQQKMGAILFFGRAECVNCHSGPALNSMEFHSYGMSDLFECGELVFNADENSVGNKGRGGFTGKQEDMFKFKVPQLYNIVQSPFYGHGSSFNSVRDVVAYKNAGVAQNVRVPQENLSEDFKPLGLSDEEINAITDFIDNALLDPGLERYLPSEVLSGHCFPFNDPVSRVELGCD